MSADMVYRVKRLVERIGKRLGVRLSDKQRSQKPRAEGHADRVKLFLPRSRLFKRLFDEVVDGEDVIARGYLGHHAAEALVYLYLRGDLIRKNARAAQNGASRLVAAALDAENEQLAPAEARGFFLHSL